jgi:septum site-determining protein MinC
LITIKSTKDGLEFWVTEETPYAEALPELKEKLNANGSFYKGSKLPVSFFGKQFTDMQKRELTAFFRDEFGIVQVNFADDEDIAATTDYLEQIEDALNEKQKDRNVFLFRTVRSGQRIECEGDITVVGDVNAGAEIIAGGNVAIFGKLRGLVHAGARGRQDVVIAATHLMPQQVSIGGKIAIIPHNRMLEGPEVVKIVDGKIVVDLIG